MSVHCLLLPLVLSKIGTPDYVNHGYLLCNIGKRGEGKCLRQILFEVLISCGVAGWRYNFAPGCSANW